MKRRTIEPHPLANLLPPMSGSEYAGLRESILVNGLREPIVLHRDGRILDGRHRQRACEELGVPVACKPFDGSDGEALTLLLDMNVRRRHLSEGQLALVAARLATLPRGANQHVAGATPTQTEAAERFGISRNSVIRARAVIEKAEPEIVAAVERGDMAVKVAASVATLPRARQLARLERDRRKAEGTHRQENDFYRTPPEVTRALLKVEKFPKKVWEPACGDGALAKVLQEAGHKVISADLLDRGFGQGGIDFLARRKRRADALVTNPPFKDADEFALHALALGVPKTALFCRLTWLEGRDRHDRMFVQRKLARVWAFIDRQTLWRGDDEMAETDGGMAAYAWFIFEQDHDSSNFTGGWL